MSVAWGTGNSLEKQIDMGRGYARQIESTTKLVTDPEITEYVNRIGQNLVRNADAQVPFIIKVVDTDDIINASSPCQADFSTWIRA